MKFHTIIEGKSWRRQRRDLPGGHVMGHGLTRATLKDPANLLGLSMMRAASLHCTVNSITNMMIANIDCIGDSGCGIMR